MNIFEKDLSVWCCQTNANQSLDTMRVSLW
jgi:hypothetical protein